MNDPADEQLEPQEDAGPIEPDEPGDELEGDGDDSEQIDEGLGVEGGEDPASAPEPEPQEDEPQGLTEKQLKALFDKLDRENERHAGRVGDILGDDAMQWQPCPLCQDHIAGFVLPQEPEPEVVARVRPFIGLPDNSAFNAADFARGCDKCNGLGVVTTGSLVQGNEAISCRGCNGSGYIVVSGPSGELVAPPAGNGQAETAVFEGVNPDDPAVAELRARGFTVMPPFQIPTQA